MDWLVASEGYFRSLPERDYVTFGPLLSQIRLSSVTFVRPTLGFETFGNISSQFCTLAIL